MHRVGAGRLHTGYTIGGTRGSPIVNRCHVAGAALAALLVAGCGGTRATPVDCKENPQGLRAALARAPGPVVIAGVRISRCFARSSDAGDLQAVGDTLLPVAERLSAEARARPASRAATELGYLVGAARVGAGRTEGIHYELERRLEQELIGVDTHAAAYVRGEIAGTRTG